MSDVQYSSDTEVPEVIPVARARADLPASPARARPRRDGRTGSRRARRSQPVYLREGLYRRSLAMADATAALLALSLIVVWDAGALFEPWVLLSMPVVILVSKIGGLYERDELVLKKTTLDEAPSLLEIAGPVRPDRLPRPELVRARHDDADAGRRAVAGAFATLFLGRVVARRLAARIATLERCLVVGDADAIRTVRGKLDGAGVNAKVVASVRIDPQAPRIDVQRFRALVRDNEVHRVIIAPVTTDVRRHARPRARRQVGRDPREPAPAPVRGRRLLRGVRPRGRADDARGPPLRAHRAARTPSSAPSTSSAPR